MRILKGRAREKMFSKGRHLRHFRHESIMYELEKYKGVGTRHTCPGCGQKRVLVRYVDEDGRYLDDAVGRCNRESKCGYHYPPKQYFADHPERSESLTPVPRRRTRKRTPAAVKQQPRLPVDFHSRKLLEGSLGHYQRNPFIRFLLNLFPDGHDGVLDVVNEYYVGYFEDLTCFWQIDVMGRIRKGKLMRYNPMTGKRQLVFDFKDQDGEPVEIPTYWVHKVLQKRNELPEQVNFQNCFFGEHLLRRERDKTIGIVEAEKTAILCSLCFPELVWIAVGAQRHLGRDKTTVLQNRKVILYPDGDAFEVWSEKLIEMQRIGIDAKISRAIEDNASVEQKAAGWDLADYLVENQTEINVYNNFVQDYNRRIDLGEPPPSRALPPPFVSPPTITSAVIQSVI
jgi:hypothetical protein